jgi:hypothetical protein
MIYAELIDFEHYTMVEAILMEVPLGYFENYFKYYAASSSASKAAARYMHSIDQRINFSATSSSETISWMRHKVINTLAKSLGNTRLQSIMFDCDGCQIGSSKSNCSKLIYYGFSNIVTDVLSVNIVNSNASPTETVLL